MRIIQNGVNPYHADGDGCNLKSGGVGNLLRRVKHKIRESANNTDAFFFANVAYFS